MHSTEFFPMLENMFKVTWVKLLECLIEHIYNKRVKFPKVEPKAQANAKCISNRSLTDNGLYILGKIVHVADTPIGLGFSDT